MSYRYNTTDIVVGVGMCAILFGGLLFFLAANGTYQTVLPQTVAPEQPTGIDYGIKRLGSVWRKLKWPDQWHNPRHGRMIPYRRREPGCG